MAKRKPYVLAIAGSARKRGNSDTLCDRVLAGAKAGGAAIDKFYLSDLEIGACAGCGACQGDDTLSCVIQDDMQTLYPLLKKCDILVLATPIYFFSMTARMKLFIDRLYPLATPKKFQLGAKRAVVCLTYGADDVLLSGCPNTVRTFTDIFTFMEIPARFIHASAWKKGDIRRNRPALRRAFEVGREAADAAIKC